MSVRLTKRTEALYEDSVVQNFPLDYNYSDEYFRFSIAGQMFFQAAKPGSRKWEETLEAFLEIGFTFVLTFTIYDANRDLMRARQAYWHKDYTGKSMWDYFTPHRGGHGSYWYRRCCESRDLCAWRNPTIRCWSRVLAPCFRRRGRFMSARGRRSLSSSRATRTGSNLRWFHRPGCSSSRRAGKGLTRLRKTMARR